MFSLVRSGCKAVGGAQGRAVLRTGMAQQTRSLILFYDDEIEDEEDSKGPNSLRDQVIKDFAAEAEEMGCNDYPHFKREHLNPSDKRVYQRSQTYKKQASRKVVGLVDYVQIKRRNGWV